MLYLNSQTDSFKGGETRFLSSNPSTSSTNEGPRPLATIKPRAGTVVIFTQDALHEGLPVEEGCKYIMRTDIMFRRVAGDWAKPYSNAMYTALVDDPVYKRTIKLLDELEQNETRGKLVSM